MLPYSYSSPRFLRHRGRISVWPRRRRWDIEAFCLQLVLNFLDGTIKLLILAFKFFPGIVVDDNVRINSVAFNDPLFAVLLIKCELRLEELATVDERQ